MLFSERCRNRGVHLQRPAAIGREHVHSANCPAQRPQSTVGQPKALTSALVNPASSIVVEFSVVSWLRVTAPLKFWSPVVVTAGLLDTFSVVSSLSFSDVAEIAAFTCNVPPPLAVSAFTPLIAPPSVAAPPLFKVKLSPLPITAASLIVPLPDELSSVTVDAASVAPAPLKLIPPAPLVVMLPPRVN